MKVDGCEKVEMVMVMVVRFHFHLSFFVKNNAATAATENSLSFSITQHGSAHNNLICILPGQACTVEIHRNRK